jgi:hypothetical protein
MVFQESASRQRLQATAMAAALVEEKVKLLS